MIADLVRVVTRDGVRLDGALCVAQGAAGVVDAVVCLHGTGGNFYGSNLFEGLAERLIEAGVAVLRVNTRGHDGVNTAVTAEGGRRLGAAYEAVADCRHDVKAWTDLLVERGYQRIGVVGHSLGAVKALYAVAAEAPVGVARVMAISPPRLSYALFHEKSAAFRETYERLRAQVDAGQGDALVEVAFPLPMLITAAGYLEKYGPDEPYDFLRHLPQVHCPTLFTFGDEELRDHPAFAGSPEAIQALNLVRPAVHVEVLAGASHFYAGKLAELADVVLRWLAA